MKTPKHLSVSTLFAALIISGASTCLFAATQSANAGSMASCSGQAAPESSLKMGMPAKAVQQLLGEPLEVRPMNSPSGKAEVWIYQRPLGESHEQVQIGSRPIKVVVKSRDAIDQPSIIGEEPILKLQRNIRAETVSVLMFNNHFLAKKTALTVTKQFE